MSGLLRFVFVGSIVVLLIGGGTYLLAGPIFFQLVSLNKQSGDQYIVVGFAPTPDLDGLTKDPFERQKKLFESEEGALLADLKIDFEIQGISLSTERRLIFYGFPSHERYLKAITDMRNASQGGTSHVIEAARFSHYGSISKESLHNLLICRINSGSSTDAAIAAVENLNKIIESHGGREVFGFLKPIVEHDSKWQSIWAFNLEDRESAVELLKSPVFQSEIVLANARVNDLSLTFYR